MLKLPHNCLISHASKVMLKILQVRLQQYMNRKLQDVQNGFRKGRGTRDQIANILRASKKQVNSRKTYISPLLTTPKHLTLWMTINWKFLKEMRIPNHLTCLLRNLYAGQEATVRTGHGTDWFQIGEKEYVKPVYCHPVYLTYMQSTSWETLGRVKHTLESRLAGGISITSICRWHQLYGRKWRGTKEPLDESERGEWKSWL